MASKTSEPLVPAWEDRWNQPTFETLMAVQKEQHFNLLNNLLERTHAYEGVERSLVWYGDAWKWTIQYSFDPTTTGTTEPLAYFVPDPEKATFCIPLREEMIAALPTKRLNRYIRDGIRSAKCAVEIHWVKWTPTAMTEVEHLMDLIKRKHKMITATK
ncbi:MAG: DUF3788 family protein [Algisphaera sp.]